MWDLPFTMRFQFALRNSGCEKVFTDFFCYNRDFQIISTPYIGLLINDNRIAVMNFCFLKRPIYDGKLLLLMLFAR